MRFWWTKDEDRTPPWIAATEAELAERRRKAIEEGDAHEKKTIEDFLALKARGLTLEDIAYLRYGRLPNGR